MCGIHPNPYIQARPGLPWPPSADDANSRRIPNKLWRLADIHTIATAQLAQAERNLIVSITDDCTANIQDLELTTGDLAERLLLLKEGDYDKSMWCQGSKSPGVRVPNEALWFPCDAYGLTIVERVSTGWEGRVEYYFKLCLSPANAVVLLVSVHV